MRAIIAHMHYGAITKEQLAYVRKFVKGRTVYDLGCGDGTYASMIARYCNRLVAVDKESYHVKKLSKLSNVECVVSYFKDYHPDVQEDDVALFFWPVNYNSTDMVTIERLFRNVIYLGSNVNMSACGSIGLWRDFASRPILEHIPDARNTLIAYGALYDVLGRPLVHEEYAAINNNEVHTYYGCPCGMGVDP